MKQSQHKVSIDADGYIKLSRIYDDNELFVTEISIEDYINGGKSFEELAKCIGELLLLDSAQARYLLKL